MKKLLIPLLIICLLLAGCAAGKKDDSANAYTVNTDDVANLSDADAQAKLGALFVTQANEEFAPTGDIAVKGANFTLSKAALDANAKSKVLTGMSAKAAVSYELSDFIITRSLYYYAVNNGFKFSNSAVNTALASKKSYNESQSDFATYLTGTGMTSSAYWNLYAKQFKITYVADAYRSSVRSQFLASSQDQSDEAWRAYFANIVKQAVDAQQLQFGDGISWQFTESDSTFLAMTYIV